MNYDMEVYYPAYKEPIKKRIRNLKVKTCCGHYLKSNKPAPEILIAPRGVKHLSKIPDSFDWMSFECHGMIVTTGHYEGVRDVADARVFGVWA